MNPSSSKLKITDIINTRPSIMETRDTLEQLFKSVWPNLSEKERRLFAASEALKWGYGGISLVSDICGLSRSTISKGLKELSLEQTDDGRIRRPGAGRPNLMRSDPELPSFLSSILDHTQRTKDGPLSPLSWTLKSTRVLARELSQAKHPISYVKVGQILKELGYNLKSNKKVGKGKILDDVAVQYELINSEITHYLSQGLPVIYLEESPSSPPAHDGPDKVPEVTQPLLDYVLELISSWWKASGEKSGLNSGKVLLIIHESKPGILLPEKSMKKMAKAGDLEVRILPFPIGTHRWNLSFLEVFEFFVRLSAETKVFLEVKAYLAQGNHTSLEPFKVPYLVDLRPK